MIVLDTYWFNVRTEGLSLGIIKARDETTGEIKFYIGTGTGDSIKMDIQLIKDWGNKVDPETIIEFFKVLTSEKPKQLPGQKKMKFKKNARSKN